MTEISAIVAELRDRAGKGAARATRREGKVPGVIYGGKQDPICIAIDPRVIWAELHKPGFKTRLFDVDLAAGGKHRCLCRDVQFHPVSDQPVHIDLMRVSADAVVHVKVPVHVINADKSPGVKAGGVVSLELHEVEVTCAPDLIPSEIVIDLAGKDVGYSVHVNDLGLPAGVTPYHVGAKAGVLTIVPPTVKGGDAEATEA
ncbi:50S ribosomal protein L25/general stress protein Ctc [Magnetospirillum gryphiswaldense]|uniref:Large ribosomal subunit protein bL25 n=1 Tax=Magnetospirillum gryphiswaldense TaxID=55518 RepID=A4TY50_9PROT|nr:50S ribosomal protein L25/general stress protein Ctc [Magnetospirillum gryphiswaldense]AVM76061.1 50S ribosomal protein L25 [Magnetospirillum gryphiswaldense MSR-1]AVM79964.1 50S ribosomal protein L25 [Magnetospirillum gryphiswaldense]CAM75557.1 50S ribosomal protein L25 [Magnetospirillum gryphiswaldense MSR-1]